MFYDDLLPDVTSKSGWGLRKLFSDVSEDDPLIRVRAWLDNTETDIYHTNGELDLDILRPANGAHAYWRIKILQAYSSSSYATVSGLEMFTTDGCTSPSACVGGTAIESGHNGSNVAAFAFDGDDTTNWESQFVSGHSGGNAWLGYQFATPVEIKQIRIRTNTFNESERPIRGAIEYSDDGVSWTEGGYFVGIDYSSSREHNFAVAPAFYVSKIYGQNVDATLITAGNDYQGFLKLFGTPAGTHYIRCDGINDRYYDETASTTRGYMIAKPIGICVMGSHYPRDAFGRPWGVLHSASNNDSPYHRIGIDFIGNEDAAVRIRVNGDNAVARGSAGMHSTGGWNAHAIVPQLGKFLQNGVISQDIGTHSTTTYPENTRLVLSGNNADGDNHGLNFVELVILGDAGATQSEIQHVVDQASMQAVGDWQYYRWRITRGFAGSVVDASIAEIELHGYAGGPDLTWSTIPAFADIVGYGNGPLRAFDNNDGTLYETGTTGPGVTPYVTVMLWDANLGQVQEVRLKSRNDAYNEYSVANYVLGVWKNGAWLEAEEVVNYPEGYAGGKVFTDAIIWPPEEVSVTFSFSYAVEEEETSSPTEEPISTTFDFGYAIEEFLVDWNFGYKIELFKTFSFRYTIENTVNDLLGYRGILPAISSKAKRAFIGWNMSGGIVGAEDDQVLPVASVYIDTPLFPAAQVRSHLHFWGDYYQRIWISPLTARLSNPKLGFDYDFFVFNAFDRPNALIDYVATDLEGVEFVEAGDMPISFAPIQFKTLHYTITPNAPATIDGRFDFEFTMGEGGFDLFALVLGVLTALPNEPMTEVWSWHSVIETSRNGSEQRMAWRDQPRTQMAYAVRVLDDNDRRKSYQQLFSFASRSVLVPMFQYLTKLDAAAGIGDTRLYFDLTQSDVRADEYVVLFNRSTDLHVIAQISTLNADGVNLVTPLSIEVDPEFWEVLPGRSMRLPNRSALGMGAVDGGATFKGESNVYRELKRPGSAVTLETYDGIPVLWRRPIAQQDIDETFDNETEVLDNESAQPVQRSNFTNPFIISTKQWELDREVDIDWWRTFLDYTKGMVRPFLMPTWREDLPLFEQPELGDTQLLTTNTDYADYFTYNAYRYVQIWSKAGVIYRKVNAVNFDDYGVVLSLDEGIGDTVGSNEDLVVSFLNLTRLNNDDVTIEHFVNWSIMTLETRTINR